MNKTVRALSFATLICVSLLFSAQAHAQPTDPLTLQDILQSALNFHPSITAANQSLTAAEGSSFAALGGFDPHITGQYLSDNSNVYPSQVFMTQLRQPTPFWGSEFYVGYRLGSGTFAPYESYLLTQRSGEFNAGVEIPLLKNSWIDDRRFSIRSTQNQAEQSAEKRLATKLKIALAATEYYFEWAAYGQKLEIRKNILNIAIARREALQSRLSAGDISKLVRLDNERLILKREVDLVESETKLREATYHLSLFYRDSAGNPKQAMGSAPRSDLNSWAEHWLDHLKPLTGPGRPEIRQGELEVDRLGEQLSLKRNQILPKLNLKLEGAQNIGGGSFAVSSTDVKAGLFLELPLFFRESRGNLSAAAATQDAWQAELQLLKNEVSVQTQIARMSVEQTGKELQLAKMELEYTEKLEQAERTIFASGGSSLINVNIREEATATAGFRVAEVQLALLKNITKYWSILGYLDFADRFQGTTETVRRSH